MHLKIKHFILISGCLLLNYCSSNIPKKQSGVMDEINFDGLYQSKKDDYSSYLRFFNDNTVLSKSSSDDPKTAAKWMHESNEGTSKGNFSIQGNAIKFSASSLSGTVDYSGEIKGNSLLLNIHSHINDFRGSREYHFVPIDFSSIKIRKNTSEKLLDDEKKGISPAYKGIFEIENIKIIKSETEPESLAVDVNYDIYNFAQNHKYQLNVYLIIDSKNILLKRFDSITKKHEINFVGVINKSNQLKLKTAKLIKVKISIDMILNTEPEQIVELCRYWSSKLKL